MKSNICEPSLVGEMAYTLLNCYCYAPFLYLSLAVGKAHRDKGNSDKLSPWLHCSYVVLYVPTLKKINLKLLSYKFMLKIVTFKEFKYRFLLEGQIVFIWLKINLWTAETLVVERLTLFVTQGGSFTHWCGLLHKQLYYSLILFPVRRLTYCELKQVQTLKHILPEFPYLASGFINTESHPQQELFRCR